MKKVSCIALVFICIAQVLGSRTDCRQCKAGHYAKRHCNEFHDTICAQCPVGTYTPKSNTRELCFSCSTCRQGFFEIKTCTFRHDTICGSCSEKEYSDLSSYKLNCVHDRKVLQNDQPVESTTEDSLDLGSGDGDLIINHDDAVKPTVIDDVMLEKVTSLPQVQNETVDGEGSGEGFPISVPSEEEFDQNVTTSTESTTTSEQPLIVTKTPTSLSEGSNTTFVQTSTTESSSSTVTETETSSTSTTPTSTSTSQQPSTSTTVITTQTTPVTTQKPTTPEPTSEATTPVPQTTPTTTASTTTSTTTETTTTSVQTTPEPTVPTTKTKQLHYSTDKDGMVIIDLRGSTVVDLRTTPTPRPTYQEGGTVKTIDLDTGDNGIVIDLGKQEEDFVDMEDNSFIDSGTKDDSPLQAGALGSKKMDDDDGIKIGIVVAVVIVAAIIFFVVGFLVSRYCRKKRSGSFKVKNDIENGSAKGSTPHALDYKDGGIYDEIDKDKATPVKNGKPNGTTRSTEDVYAVPDKRKSNPPESPKLEEQLDKIKFIDDTEEEAEASEGDKLLEDSDEKYSSFASIPNGSVKQNGDVTTNDYVSESSPMLSSRDTPDNKEPSDEGSSNEKEIDNEAEAEKSPLIEKSEGEDKQADTSSS